MSTRSTAARGLGGGEQRREHKAEYLEQAQWSKRLTDHRLATVAGRVCIRCLPAGESINYAAPPHAQDAYPTHAVVLVVVVMMMMMLLLCGACTAQK